MEDLQPAHAGLAAEEPRLSRGQVVALRRLIDVLLEKRRLAIKEVGAAHEIDDLLAVVGAVERVDDVADLLAARFDDEVAERGEREALFSKLANRAVVANHRRHRM